MRTQVVSQYPDIHDHRDIKIKYLHCANKKHVIMSFE